MLDERIGNSRRVLKVKDLIKIKSVYYYVFRVENNRAFLFKVVKSKRGDRGIYIYRRLYIPKYDSFRCLDITFTDYTYIGTASEFVPYPEKGDKYIKFVEETVPSLKFGDIIKAVRPLDTALPQFHSVGH